MKKIFITIVISITFAMALSLTSCSKKEAAATTPATILCQQFTKITKADSSISLEDLANKLVTNDIIPFGPAIMPVAEGYLNGFSSEVTGFSEAVMFGPMIGSIPFMGYVFKTDNPQALISSLKEKADLRWNVCTQADEMVVDSVKNTVFFVMSPISFEEDSEDFDF